VSIVALALVAAGSVAAWWLHLRGPRGRLLPAPAFDEDAAIAIHVARHDLKGRAQAPSTLHLLYGLLQVDRVTAAIAASGGDVAALEDRVLDALATGEPADDEALQRLLVRASTFAHHGGRPITCADLWAFHAGSRAAAVLAAASIDLHAVLFWLVHDEPPPDLAPALTSDVYVVLKNDGYSTMELVVEVLVEDFGLAREPATELMMAVHTAGRGVVGRYSLTRARDLVLAARARAAAGGWPLWIGVEPA